MQRHRYFVAHDEHPSIHQLENIENNDSNNVFSMDHNFTSFARELLYKVIFEYSKNHLCQFITTFITVIYT